MPRHAERDQRRAQSLLRHGVAGISLGQLAADRGPLLVLAEGLGLVADEAQGPAQAEAATRASSDRARGSLVGVVDSSLARPS